jgi:mediator of RNA polymerase II transcription subunit 12
VEIFLQTSNTLFKILLSEEESSDPDTPTADLFDLQRIRTRRQDVYREPHFSALVSNIPTLIAIEKNVNVSEDLRRASTALRIALCADQSFCQGAHRNLDAIREVFEQPLNSDTISDEFREALIDALCLVLWESREGIVSCLHTMIATLNPSISDIPSNWQNLSLLLSPLRLGATAIVLQFILKHMSRELSQEDSNKAVDSRLDELTLAIFRQPMTSKEAYFVAQMTKDVGNDIAGKVMRSLIVLPSRPDHQCSSSTMDCDASQISWITCLFLPVRRTCCSVSNERKRSCGY